MGIGMDFITDCPAAVVALGVCGSVLAHDEKCNFESLPAYKKCLQKEFEVAPRSVSVPGGLLVIAVVVWLCLVMNCGCYHCCCNQGVDDDWFNYLICASWWRKVFYSDNFIEDALERQRLDNQRP